MYILKQLPEDFVVTEIPSISKFEHGKYLYFWMKKKGRNTLDVVKELSRKLGIQEKSVGFAGSKDKHAVTEQLISVLGVKKEKAEKIELKDAALEFYGFGNTPISLGDLKGNKFEIVIRNLEEEKIEKISLIENYFDEQRFSEHNVKIGKHIVKKEFAQAVSLIDDIKVKNHSEKKANDYVGALKILPLRLLRMYVNAYQSYLWNKTVAEFLVQKGKVLKKVSYSGGEFVFVSNPEKFKNLKIPLIGFGHEYVDNVDVQNIIDEIMKEDNLSYTDFIIKQMPELTLEGELRDVLAEIKDLKIGKKAKDELNQGKKKVMVSFTLPKGSYATMAIKRMVS